MGDITLGGMNIVDVMILVVFFLSVLIGFGRGFLFEAFSLLTIVAAFVVATIYSNSLAAYFSNTAMMQALVSSTSDAVGSSTAQPISYLTIGISFAILFGMTYIIGNAVTILINLVFLGGILGLGNRLMGALFGLIRGYLIILALIFLVQLSPFSSQPWWLASGYVPLFQTQVVWLGKVVSPVLNNIQSTFDTGIQKVTESVGEVKGKIKRSSPGMEKISDTIQDVKEKVTNPSSSQPSSSP